MAHNPFTNKDQWPSLRLEGSLIAPAMIDRIGQRSALEQAPEDYSVRKGLTIREEISTAFRVGQSHFDAFTRLGAPSQDATQRFIYGFFKETFGFDDLEPAEAPLALIAGGSVPVVVAPPPPPPIGAAPPCLLMALGRPPLPCKTTSTAGKRHFGVWSPTVPIST